MKVNFVNNAVDLAIKNYLENKNNKNSIIYNSFLVVVVRTLSVIYDELDVIGPYLGNNKDLFCLNLTKYGYSQNDLYLFFDNLNKYLETEFEIPNKYFVEIEKALIDMYFYKKLSIKVNDLDEYKFKSLLYSPEAINELMISYNFMNTEDENIIMNYYKSKLNPEQEKNVVESKELLSPEAYKIINQNYTNVSLLDDDMLKKVNDEVYNKLDIKKNAVNFDYLFEKKLSEFYNQKEKLTTGNGYVDILLVIGIIVTIIMIVIIATILF